MQPVWLADGRLHVDGGVRDRLGLASCSREERVLNVGYWNVRSRAGALSRRAVPGVLRL